MTRSPPILLLALLLVPIVGCRTVPPLEEQPETVWAYLVDTYDGDGDHIVTSTEYSRGEEKFKRLDRDRDGQLTEKDFAPRPRGGSSQRKNQAMAQQALVRYFQADEDPQDLTRDELEMGFATKDVDSDGLLSEEEYRGSRESSGPGYSALLAVADKDESGNLTVAELYALFDARDGNKDGVWSMSGRSGSSRGSGGSRPMSGPPPGKVAPDFTLAPPDGEAPVTLSSFANDRPVALIFASFT